MKNLMINNYWNSLAKNYTDEVLEIAHYDLRGVLKEEVAVISKQANVVADLGCGPGRLLELLCPYFKKVKAVDYAADLLKIAQARYNFSNVEYILHNLSGSKPLNLKMDATFCVNVMISPVYGQRLKIAQKVWAATKKNGLSVFVVPALESVFHVYHTLIRCQMSYGITRLKSLRDMETDFEKDVISTMAGTVKIGETPTKCYMQEELVGFLKDIGYEVLRTRKIEYSWSEEIENVPDWLRDSYPWDWFVLVRKNK